MKATKRLTNNAGFSLIELMVVVAIIGVLASIAVPSVGKYMAKSRQSEAKSNLASYYTSQKAFFAEWNSYDSRFGAIGYSPEGKVVYNVGNGTTFTAPGYTLPTGALTNIALLGYCGNYPTFTNGCSIVNAPIVPGMAAGTTVTAVAFVGGASGNIRGGSANAQDQWTIDQNKQLTNTVDGTR